MKLLLINPFLINSQGFNLEVTKRGGQYAEPPIGLGYLSSYCKHYNNIDVKILDANIYAIEKITIGNVTDIDSIENGIVDEIKKYGPDVVGISCLFHSTSRSAHRMALLVKDLDKDITVIMGGSYPTASSELVLKDPNVDFIVKGEGEKTLSDIINYLNKNGSLDNISGIGYKDNNKIIIKESDRYINDIEQLMMPDREDLPIESYSKYARHALKKFIYSDTGSYLITSITASRGCPHQCDFCISKIFWNRQYRHRSADSILDEIEYLVKRYNVTHLAFNDDNLTINLRFTKELFSGMIKRGIKVKWMSAGGLQLNTIDTDLTEIMLESGCTLFNLAIESGSKKTLKKIRKPLQLDSVEEKIDIIRRFENRYPVYIEGYFLFGFPDETEEDFRETISFARRLDLDWRMLSCVQPFPGTELYNDALEKGLIPADLEENFGNFSYQKLYLKTNYLNEELIEKEVYLLNIESNFLNNRNLQMGNYKQAIRDFEWVLELVPDHAIARYCLYVAHKKNRDLEKANTELINIEKYLTPVNKSYFDHFNIDIESFLLNLPSL